MEMSETELDEEGTVLDENDLLCMVKMTSLALDEK